MNDTPNNFAAPDVPAYFVRTLEQTIEALRTRLSEVEAGAAAMRRTLESLQNWRDPDSVSGNGDYAFGLNCGVEDKGYQTDGYSAMRYGYDAALDRVSEEIDSQIEEALSTDAGKAVAKELEDLRQWKAEMLQVTASLQLWEVANACGMELGSDIAPQLLPWIVKAKKETQALRTRNDALVESLESIRDISWDFDTTLQLVDWMRNKARTALAGTEEKV